MNNTLNPEQKLYIKRILSSFWFKLFTLMKLPSMAFWGVKVVDLNEQASSVSIKYKWSAKNPFKSLYFSALFGAAELSTGILCQMYLQGQGNWSMLVVEANGQFVKKAVGRITFTCDQGEWLQKEISKIKEEGNGSFLLKSTGVDEQGDPIGHYQFKWSLKYKGQ